MVRIASPISERNEYGFSAGSWVGDVPTQQTAPSSKYLIEDRNYSILPYPQPSRIGTIWLAQADIPNASPVREMAAHNVPKEAVFLYNQGMALRKKGKYAEAKEFFEKAIAIDPQYYEARIERALMMYNLDKDKEADAEIKKVIEEDPANTSARVASTVFLIFGEKAPDLDSAKEILQEALKVNPNDVRANYLMSTILVFRRDYKKALIYLRKIEALDKDNEVYLHPLCGALLLTKDKDALPCFKKMLDREPDNLHANIGIAQIYLGMGRGSDAIPYLERALISLPDNPDMHFVFAGILNKHGRQDEAIAHYEKVIALAPNNWDVRFTLAALYYKKGQLDKALSIGETGFKIAMESPHLETNPRLSVATLFVGWLFIEKLCNDSAVGMAQKCLSRFPDSPNCHFLLGLGLSGLAKGKQDFQESVKEYELAVKNGFEDIAWVSLYLARDLIYGLGEYDKGIEILKNILPKELSKEDKITAYSFLGDALGAQNRNSEALKCFEKAYSLDQNIERINAKIGYIHKELGHNGEAVKYLKIAIEREPDYQPPYKDIAEAYNNLEQNNDALAVIQKATEKFPDVAYFYGIYGLLLKQAEKYEDAVRAFRKALELDQSTQVYHDMGESLYLLDRIPEAIWALEEGLKKDPKSQPSFYWLGKALIKAEKLDQAISVFKKLVELDKTAPIGFEQLAIAYEKKGLYKEAVENRRIVIKLVPKNPWGHINLANALMRAGLSLEAVSEYERAVSLEPKDSDLYLAYGLALKEQGKEEMAGEVFKRGLRFSPQSAQLYLEFAECLTIQRKYERAIQLFKHVLELKDKGWHARTHYSLGIIYEIQKRDKEAEEEYRAAASLYIDSMERSALVSIGLAGALWRQGKKGDAFKEIYKAKGLAPLNSSVRRFLADRLYDEHRLEEAIAELRDLLKVNQKDVEVYSRLGLYLFRAGRKEEAKDVYMKGLAIKPDNPEILNNFGYDLLLMDEVEKGTEYISKALTLAPGDPYCLSSLGYAYFKSGRYDEAVELLRRSAKKFEEQKDENYEVCSQLGIALLQKGHADEAIIHLERALKLNPEDKEMQKAMQAARDKKAGKETTYDMAAMSRRTAYRITQADYAIELPFATVAFDEVERDIEKRMRAAEIGLRTEYARKFFKSQQPAEAVVQLRRSIELDPENCQLHVQLGYALMELHRYAQAIGSFERALELSPLNESAKKGRERGMKKLSEGFAPIFNSMMPVSTH